MSRHQRCACLLAGLALAAGSFVAWRSSRAAAAEDAPAPQFTPLPARLPAPQWVSGTDARGKVLLVWIRNPAFASVRVHRREEGSAEPFRPLAQTKANSWTDETVQPGRSYLYRLSGIAPDGREGRPSAELVVRVGVVTLRPPAPPDWEGYLPVEDGVQLRWNARPGEDVIAWNIYRRSPPETEFRLVGSARGTVYRDTGLEPERTYVYALTALDSSFRETPFSSEITVVLRRAPARPDRRPPAAWVVRRTKLVALVGGGKDLPFERPADVAVGPVSGSVYVADSSRNLVFVFSAEGVFQRALGLGETGGRTFKNLLGVATDREENLYVVDAGAGAVWAFPPREGPVRRVNPAGTAGETTGLIDAAVGPDGRVFVVDNYNNRVAILGGAGPMRSFGQAGAKGGEFSAPTFCALDKAGNLFVADCLNARVQVFAGGGEFVRFFGSADRGPGGFGRPKGVAVGAGGEVYVADSWLNTVQVFDAEGRFVAILGDDKGRPLDLGSPNGVALGPGNRVYVAERLAARLQIRELIDGR
jgi:DNA-binding beta-propeller fold protein YncE